MYRKCNVGSYLQKKIVDKFMVMKVYNAISYESLITNCCINIHLTFNPFIFNMYYLCNLLVFKKKKSS